MQNIYSNQFKKENRGLINVQKVIKKIEKKRDNLINEIYEDVMKLITLEYKSNDFLHMKNGNDKQMRNEFIYFGTSRFLFMGLNSIIALDYDFNFKKKMKSRKRKAMMGFILFFMKSYLYNKNKFLYESKLYNVKKYDHSATTELEKLIFLFTDFKFDSKLSIETDYYKDEYYIYVPWFYFSYDKIINRGISYYKEVERALNYQKQF